MKKAFLVWIALVGLIFSTHSMELKPRGYTVVDQRVEGAFQVYELKDEGGRPFSVEFSLEIDEQQLPALNAILDTFAGMKYIKPANLRIVFNRQEAEISLTPREFTYGDMDLAALMPSGMQFFYTNTLEYDFSLLIENLRLRLRGQYFDEEQFADTLVRAAQNPAAFIQSQDPEYVIRRFEEGERLVALLQNENKTQKEQLESLRADLAALRQELELARYAIMVYHNRGFFGGLHLPDQEAVQRAVALKKADPSLTKDQVISRLKEEGFSLSGNEAFLVLSLYFSQFE